jgi:hypothetical protein
LTLRFSDPADRNRFLRATIPPGTIVRLHFARAKPVPKEKYFLIVSLNPLTALFIINSRPNDFIMQRFADLQVRLERSDYPSFLKHTSYIDCSQPIQSISESEIIKALGADYSRRTATITEETKAAVKKAIQQNRTLSPHVRGILLREFNQ